MAYVVGLTGGIGSGKSAVAEAFAGLGVDVTDTDRIAHAVTAPGQEGLAAVVAEFGERMLTADGRLDRGALRERVFADPDARRRLEAILHPLIRALARSEVARWSSPYGLLVVPLLFERGGHRDLVRRTLVVDCPEEIQVARVMERSGLSAAQVRAIMATQLSRAERLARADDVLDNGGPRSAIGDQVADLHQRYLRLALDAERQAGAYPSAPLRAE